MFLLFNLYPDIKQNILYNLAVQFFPISRSRLDHDKCTLDGVNGSGYMSMTGEEISPPAISFISRAALLMA